MGYPQKNKDKAKDKDATDTLNTYVFDPNDIRIHAFFLEGEPEGKELEGIEEVKLLEIHGAFQQKLKERDAEQEKNITKKIQKYEQKYDFINKALLESVAQITEMTKPDQSAATARVKLAETRWSCYCHCLMALSQR